MSNCNPGDWNFYAEQLRKKNMTLKNRRSNHILMLEIMEKGVFAAEQLYGITFKERNDLPVYHPDVVTYEVFDNDEHLLFTISTFMPEIIKMVVHGWIISSNNRIISIKNL
ncbi:MAG: M3 family metallopeptidase [Saprospiraceae bacterium]